MIRIATTRHRYPFPFLTILSTATNHPFSLFYQQQRYATSISLRHKLVTLEDAVALVRNGTTLAVSGFVSQAAPEALLEALEKRFLETREPRNLTLLFGGGPGDWDSKGLNHLAHPEMLKTAIGGHYGQVPKIAKLVLSNQIEAYNLPLGTVSRIIRCTSTRQPGYLTSIGLGTMADPKLTGGKLNKKTTKDIVERITIGGKDYLFYPSIPLQVAFIRGTTADPEGNITMEHESLLGDVRNIAMATKNSGGVVIAQVERIAAYGSLSTNHVHIPGVLVDCICQVEESKHQQSYFTKYNPAWSGEIRVPIDSIPYLKMSERKIIARRAALELKPNQVVNLGIGMPEGVASVANEEKIFQYLTLTTEAGMFGGVGAMGHDFGPAVNSQARMEMNQTFDFYNGGGLGICFLGLAQVNESGDVNVSRLSESALTGPGGFIDISQSTLRVVFMGTFTAKGLEIAVEDGKLKILKEGKVKKFTKNLLETTFSGNEAIRRGQRVLYITERCVFTITQKGVTLIEVAPGIDIEKDIIQQMEFKPYVPNKPKVMNLKLFSPNLMDLKDTLFALNMDTRLNYVKKSNTLFVDFSGLVLGSKAAVVEVLDFIENKISTIVKENNGERVNVVANYSHFDVRQEMNEFYWKKAQYLEKTYYKSVKRYGGDAFTRAKLAQVLAISDPDDVWQALLPLKQDTTTACTALTTSPDYDNIFPFSKLRQGLFDVLHVNVTELMLHNMRRYVTDDGYIKKENFPHILNLVTEQYDY